MYWFISKPYTTLNDYVAACYFPEMRAKFDHGEDPMDPESQQGHHHHHFHGGFHGFQGFNPFGSGPFNFKFNFNWGGSYPTQLEQRFAFSSLFTREIAGMRNAVHSSNSNRNVEQIITLIQWP